MSDLSTYSRNSSLTGLDLVPATYSSAGPRPLLFPLGLMFSTLALQTALRTQSSCLKV